MSVEQKIHQYMSLKSLEQSASQPHYNKLFPLLLSKNTQLKLICYSWFYFLVFYCCNAQQACVPCALQIPHILI